jgi:ABC-type nickel/cobalt efflux system permease component RcnA
VSVAGALVVFLVVSAAPASAHPLGNFTTNRYARVEVGASLIRVRYVLDEAELVAFRSRAALASAPDSVADDLVSSIRSNLALHIDGRAVSLRPVSHRLTTPPGQGGLTTLRLEVLYEGALPAGDAGDMQAEFTDDNGPELLGWREIVVRGVDGTRIASSTVRAEDATDELRSYPSDPSVRPLDIRSASFSFRPSGRSTDGPARLGKERGPLGGRSGDRFVRLLADTSSSPFAIAGALLVALLVGAAHALGPGHGKTVMGAYLVSTSGRRRDAITLGVIVSLMHTASVLVLAGLLATVGRSIDAQRLYPALTFVAGLLVVAVGANLVRTRTADRRRQRPRSPSPTASPARVLVGVGARTADVHEGSHHHDHDHDHHDEHKHEHAGIHAHGGRAHSHELDAGVRPLSRAGLLALGTSGGLFPSPSAVVVLVGAFVAGRAPLGLALIAAFSTGLATVLVAIGLLLVAGRDRLRASRFAVTLPWLPTAGAVAILVLGAVLMIQGASTIG